ncbi:MAG: pentapeptide repeat-containing protein [Candidatus Sericytochromatia bacterium]
MINKFKISINILCILALINSCSVPNKTEFFNSNISQNNSNNKINEIRGKVEFPESKKTNNFKTKATIGQIKVGATISLIYPPDDSTNPNVTIATGLTDTNGNFLLNVNSFTPETGKIYILEGIKRIGASGNDKLSIRTYIKWNGTTWESITSPNISLNKTTTAITIIDKNDNSISSSDTIGKIVSGVVNPIGSVTTQTINNVANLSEYLLNSDADPTRFISYLNNKYYIIKELSLNKNQLLLNKSCANCELDYEDLSNKTLDNSNLKYVNLSNTNLSNTNLSNSSLNNSNLSNSSSNNVTLTNSNLSNSSLNNITLTNSNLSTVNLTNSSLNNVTLTNSNLSTVNLTNSTLTSSNLSGSNFTGSILTNANLSNSNFTNATLTNSNLIGANLTNINISGANLTGATWIDGRICQNNSISLCRFPDSQANTHTTNEQKRPSIAMDSTGNFVITWQSFNQDGSGYGIYAQRYNSLGQAQGSEFRVNTYTTNNQQKSRIAMDSNGNFVITWESYSQDSPYAYGIYAQRYNSLGQAQGSEFQVNTYVTYNQKNSSIAMDSTGNFIITWQSENQDSSGYGIYAQRYNSLGQTQGSEFRVNTHTTNNQQKPSVSMDSTGNFAIAWESKNQASANSYYDVYSQKYNSDGIAQGSEFKVNIYITNNQQNVSISIKPSNFSNFIITWNSLNQLNGLDIYRSSAFDVLVNTTTFGQQENPVVSYNNLNNIISWQSGQDGSGTGIYASKTGSTEFQINSYTTSDQLYPAIASNNTGNFVITWESNGQDGSGSGIYFKRYDSNANQL